MPLVTRNGNNLTNIISLLCGFWTPAHLFNAYRGHTLAYPARHLYPLHPATSSHRLPHSNDKYHAYTPFTAYIYGPYAYGSLSVTYTLRFYTPVSVYSTEIYAVCVYAYGRNTSRDDRIRIQKSQLYCRYSQRADAIMRPWSAVPAYLKIEYE